MRRMKRDDEGIAIVLVTIGHDCPAADAQRSRSTSVSCVLNKGRAQNSADACPWRRP